MAYRILCIEDNPDNMRLVQRVLEARGYRLLQANSGRLGLELAERELPDVILLDINLPDLDGYEVARRLRSSSDSRVAKTPIIAITANAMRSDALKALAAGCDRYMSKPINLQELWDLVEASLPESG